MRRRDELSYTAHAQGRCGGVLLDQSRLPGSEEAGNFQSARRRPRPLGFAMTEKLAVGGDTLPSPKRYSSEIMLMKFRLLTTFLCVQLAVSEEKAMAPHSNGTPLQWYSYLENPMDGGAWWAAVHGVAKSWTRLRDFTFIFNFYALEKEMATHSSVLAWRIPGTGEPGGLPSLGSHRVGHD